MANSPFLICLAMLIARMYNRCKHHLATARLQTVENLLLLNLLI
jgi:hypothetical protein